MKVKLGDEVKDVVTGFTGFVLACHTYMEGCKRFTIQPVVDKDGKVPQAETFDEPSLEIITRNAVDKMKEESSLRLTKRTQDGGPEKYRPQPRVEGKRK